MNAALRSGLTLAAIAGVCAALVAATWVGTRDRIADNQRAFLEQSLEPALAGVFYDGNITESPVTIAPPHDLPGNAAVLVYRVYRERQPVAALLAVTARDGYAGPIRILVGIDFDGTVTGLRILEHRETPGLGDRIESSRTDWVYQFDGRALGDPPAERWKIRRDGGDFDQLSGASVTPRAVIKALAQTLEWYAANRDALFALPADGEAVQ